MVADTGHSRESYARLLNRHRTCSTERMREYPVLSFGQLVKLFLRFAADYPDGLAIVRTALESFEDAESLELPDNVIRLSSRRR